MPIPRLLVRREPSARVAFNMRPLEHPWGGGNWWLAQMVSRLRQEGYEVRFDLKREPDVLVVVDPRVGGNVVFGHAEIAAHRERHPEARVLHRVNECDLRKGTNEIDALLAEMNAVADHTVFISEWLRDYHAGRWYELARPHSVILNGASTEIFNPDDSEELPEGGPMRLVTHHWSSNPRKGFDVYAQVDGLIANRELEGLELTYEALVADPARVVEGTLGFLGVEVPETLVVSPGTKRQFDEVNEEWIRRYRELSDSITSR